MSGTTSQKLSSSSSEAFGPAVAFLPDLAVTAGGAAGVFAVGGAGFAARTGTGVFAVGGLGAWGTDLVVDFLSSSGDERSELHAFSEARGVVGLAGCSFP